MTPCIDLHGYTHEDARRAVIRFVESNWDVSGEYEVITGHSTKMRGVVMNVLEEYNLPYNIGSMFDPMLPKVIFWIGE